MIAQSVSKQAIAHDMTAPPVPKRRTGMPRPRLPDDLIATFERATYQDATQALMRWLTAQRENRSIKIHRATIGPGGSLGFVGEVIFEVHTESTASPRPRRER